MVDKIKDLKLSPEVHKRLTLYKFDKDLKTFDDTIKFLLDLAK